MMGTGCARKTNYVIRGLGLWAWVQQWRKAGEWVHSLDRWFNKLCLCNEILKPLDTETQVSSFIGELIHVPRGWPILIPQKEGKKADPPKSCCLCLFIWLVLVYILYIKTIILSTMLSWVLWVVLANYLIWGVHEKKPSKFVAGIRSEGCLTGACVLNL